MRPNSPPPPDTLPEEAHYPLRKSKSKPASPLPPLWSVALTFFFALMMAGCLIGALIALGGRGAVQEAGRPVIQITPAVLPTSLRDALIQPTVTPEIDETAPSPAQNIDLSGPTLVPTPTATPTPIAITTGARVIVISQGGINVRATPGTSGAVNFTANNNETFAVIAGPEVVDGLRWWQLQDTTNNRSGWVAENDGIADLIRVYVP